MDNRKKKDRDKQLRKKIKNCYLELITLCEQDRCYDEAIKYAKELYEFEPDNNENFIRITNLMMKKDQYSCNEKYTSVVEKKEYTQAEKAFDLGKAFLEEERYEIALERFKQVLTYNPEHTDALKKITWTLILMYRFKEALTYSKTNTQLRPLDPETWVWHGFTYFCMEDYKKAKEIYFKAYKINNKHWFVLHSLGGVFKIIKNFNKAIDCYRKLTVAYPEDPYAWGALAKVYKKMNENEKAERCLRKQQEILKKLQDKD